jgi:hypothetical protein
MIPEINTRLIAVRSKLRRSIILNTNVIYEVYASIFLSNFIQPLCSIP